MRQQQGGFKRRAALCAGACALVLATPGSAQAWKYKFQDFFDYAPGGASAGAVATAKKCSGGKFGVYRFRSISRGEGGETELEIEVRAEMPVTAKLKPLRDVDVSVQASQNFDPKTIAAVTVGLSDFFETVAVQWRGDGELFLVHGPLSFFGHQIMGAEELIIEFKPKPGC